MQLLSRNTTLIPENHQKAVQLNHGGPKSQLQLLEKAQAYELLSKLLTNKEEADQAYECLFNMC